MLGRGVSITMVAAAALSLSSGAGVTATLEEVVARLEKLERENKAIKSENASLLRLVNGDKTRKRLSEASAPITSVEPPRTVRESFASVTPPRSSWSGITVGFGGGYGWGQSSQTDSGLSQIGNPICIVNPRGCAVTATPTPTGVGDGRDPATVTPTTVTGGDALPADGWYKVQNGFVGAHTGVNWQLGSFVVGLEQDIYWSGIEGKSATCGAAVNAPHSCGTKLEAFGTLRNRIGYSFGSNDDWLVYGTAGVAFGQIKGWDNLFRASGSKFKPGWAVGGGIEKQLANNISARIEYIHLDFGKDAYFDIIPNVPESISLKVDLVKAGLSYRLGQ